MIRAFLAGLAAGYGIAIPVGAVAVIIVETGLRYGFRAAAAAGAGTASADGVYAAIAAIFGAALAAALTPWLTPLRAAAVVVLVALAVRGLRSVARDAERASRGSTEAARSAGGATGPDFAGSGPRSPRRRYAAFLGLTLLNPMTITYFAALIVGLDGTGTAPVEKLAFVVGAFGASLSWQTLIAAVGSALHRRLGPGLRLAVGITGNLIVLAFAAVIAAGLAR